MKVFHREKKLLLMLDSDERGTAKFRILSNQSLLHGRQGRGELVCHPPEDLSDIATKSYQGLPMFVTIGE